MSTSTTHFSEYHTISPWCYLDRYLDLLLGSSLRGRGAGKATCSITVASVRASAIVDRIGHSALRGPHRVLPGLGLPLIVVLTRVDVLPANVAEEVIEARCQE